MAAPRKSKGACSLPLIAAAVVSLLLVFISGSIVMQGSNFGRSSEGRQSNKFVAATEVEERRQSTFWNEDRTSGQRSKQNGSKKKMKGKRPSTSKSRQPAPGGREIISSFPMPRRNPVDRLSQDGLWGEDGIDGMDESLDKPLDIGKTLSAVFEQSAFYRAVNKDDAKTSNSPEEKQEEEEQNLGRARVPHCFPVRSPHVTLFRRVKGSTIAEDHRVEAHSRCLDPYRYGYVMLSTSRGPEWEARLLQCAWLRVFTRFSIVLMVQHSVLATEMSILAALGVAVVEVPRIRFRNIRLRQSQLDKGDGFQLFQIWRLEGLNRVIYLSPTAVPVRNLDYLFNVDDVTLTAATQGDNCAGVDNSDALLSFMPDFRAFESVRTLQIMREFTSSELLRFLYPSFSILSVNSVQEEHCVGNWKAVFAQAFATAAYLEYVLNEVIAKAYAQKDNTTNDLRPFRDHSLAPRAARLVIFEKAPLLTYRQSKFILEHLAKQHALNEEDYRIHSHGVLLAAYASLIGEDNAFRLGLGSPLTRHGSEWNTVGVQLNAEGMQDFIRRHAPQHHMAAMDGRT